MSEIYSSYNDDERAMRVPPHNDDAERSVLGAMMLDQQALGDALEIVKAEDFYNKNHQVIYKAIDKLYADNTPVDVLTVTEELQKEKAMELAGGIEYVASLTDVPSTANAAEYAKIVSEKSTLRQMIKAGEGIVEKGFAADMNEDEILDYAEKSVFKISQRHQKSDYTPIKDVLIENIHILDEAEKNKGQVRGVPSGYKDLDNLTNGFQKSSLIIVAARPAMGKTAFALNIALQSAVKHNASVLVFNLEMSKEEVGQRLLAMQARVDSQKMKKGELERKDWEKISIATDEMSKGKIYLDDNGGVGIMEIKNKCRRLKANEGLDLVIVDYLQLMQSTGKSESRLQEISALTRQFKLLARELDCPIILLSQLSRGPEQRQDHHPMLADLRESGSIEQDADMVIFLYRDEVYNPNTEKPGVCEVDIAKHRAGPTGVVELTWLGQYTKFCDKAF